MCSRRSNERLVHERIFRVYGDDYEYEIQSEIEDDEDDIYEEGIMEADDATVGAAIKDGGSNNNGGFHNAVKLASPFMRAANGDASFADVFDVESDGEEEEGSMEEPKLSSEDDGVENMMEDESEEEAMVVEDSENYQSTTRSGRKRKRPDWNGPYEYYSPKGGSDEDEYDIPSDDDGYKKKELTKEDAEIMGQMTQAEKDGEAEYNGSD